MVKQNITIRIEPELLQTIDQIAKEEYRTRTNVINYALEKLIEHYHNLGTLKGLLDEK